MPRKKTTDEWIDDARKVWGDVYDYSAVQYQNTQSPVTVICPKHGPWNCNPRNHIVKSKPRGCPACGRENQITKATRGFDDFVRDARSIHGNQYKYDSEAYKNAKVKTKIICPVHGLFMQTPDGHISGRQGCPKCGQEEITQQQLLPIEEVNIRLSERSDGQVTIVPETYRGFNYDADFICNRHGRYTRLVNSTVTSNPCLLCSKENGFYLHHTTESFKVIILSKFGNKYKIDEFKYGGQTTPVTLVCETHGPFTLQAQAIHKSPGCPKCAHKASQEQRRNGLLKKHKSTLNSRYIKWLDAALDIYDKKYDYSLVDYKQARTKVDIICPVHGIFKQEPHVHLRSGCQKCAHEDLKGRYTEKYFEDFPERKCFPAILYYLKFKRGNLTFYKVGITTTTIAERFMMLNKTDIDYVILGEYRTSLFEAFTAEQVIQESHGDKFRYTPKLEGIVNREIRIGPTECFRKKLDESTRKLYFL